MIEFLFDTTRAVMNLVLNGSPPLRPGRLPCPRQLGAILALTTLEHLHYGSDYPFTPEFVVEMGAQALANAGDPAGSVARALAGNSRQLFPGSRNMATE